MSKLSEQQLFIDRFSVCRVDYEIGRSAAGQKFFEGRFRHYGNSLDIHSDPCACTGICFRLSGPKVTVQIVRSSLGLRCATATVPFANTDNRTLFVEGLMGTRGIAFQLTRSPSTNIVRSFVSRERNRSEQVSET